MACSSRTALSKIWPGTRSKASPSTTETISCVIIADNTFQNLATTRKAYVAIVIGGNKTRETATDILITRNRFERCEKRIAAGIYHGKEYPLLPRNIVVRGNVFISMGEGGAFDFIPADPGGALRAELHEADNECLRR